MKCQWEEGGGAGDLAVPSIISSTQIPVLPGPCVFPKKIIRGVVGWGAYLTWRGLWAVSHSSNHPQAV